MKVYGIGEKKTLQKAWRVFLKIHNYFFAESGTWADPCWRQFVLRIPMVVPELIVTGTASLQPHLSWVVSAWPSWLIAVWNPTACPLSCPCLNTVLSWVFTALLMRAVSVFARIYGAETEIRKYTDVKNTQAAASILPRLSLARDSIEIIKRISEELNIGEYIDTYMFFNFFSIPYQYKLCIVTIFRERYWFHSER